MYVLKMQIAKIVLDESKYGNTTNEEWRWSFKSSDSGKLITTRYISELIAVSPSQFKTWSNQKIIVEKRPKINLWIALMKNYFKLFTKKNI